jgi:hypothetical protein
LPPNAELQWWYQYYFATDRDRPAMTNTGTILRSSFGRPLHPNGILMMPRSIAAAFDNPDHVSIVIRDAQAVQWLAQPTSTQAPSTQPLLTE